MPRYIRLGDRLSSGGVVMSAASHVVLMGKALACQGDEVRCPLPGHGLNRIAEGDPAHRCNGRAAALEGHACECGCTLISSLPQAGRR